MKRSYLGFATMCAPILLVWGCGGDASESEDEDLSHSTAPTGDAGTSDQGTTLTDSSVTPASDAGAEAAIEAAPTPVVDAVAEVTNEAAPADVVVTPAGPCADVPAGHAAVIFTAPTPHEDLIGFAAWIDYPSFSGMADTAFSDPYPGCVAVKKTDDTLRCDFSVAPEGTKIHFVTGVYADQASHATDWFTQAVDGGFQYFGSYTACVGTAEVGTLKSSAFTGSLSSSDENVAPQNLLFTVPAH